MKKLSSSALRIEGIDHNHHAECFNFSLTPPTHKESLMETSLHPIGSGLYGGWVQKKGRGRGLAGFFGFFRPWNMRFVTVNPRIGLMSYYKSKDDGEARREETGHVHLKDAIIRVKNTQLIVEVELHQEVQIIGSGGEFPGAGEVLFLKAMNDEHLCEWVSILSAAST